MSALKFEMAKFFFGHAEAKHIRENRNVTAPKLAVSHVPACVHLYVGNSLVFSRLLS